MPKAKSAFLEFVHRVVNGEIDEVSRRLAASPALATAPADVGATRQRATDFFFAEIAHYLYAGDTALHMAASAFRRPIAMLLIAHGADCRAMNRRCTGRSAPGRCRQSGLCWMEAPTRGGGTSRALRPFTLPFKPPGPEVAVLNTHASSRGASSGS